jgi:NAD-dependent epimerase/dehydratase family protein
MVSVQESVQKPNECAEINALGTAIVLEEAARARVKKLIFSSSAVIYGVLAYPAILRAIEMVGRQNVYFVVFEDNRFILDAMEIIPCVNAYNNRQSVCRNNLCMQAITVNDVFKEVTGIYDSLKRTTCGN